LGLKKQESCQIMGEKKLMNSMFLELKLAILYADIFNLISRVISRSFVYLFILKKKTIKQIKPWDFFCFG
jgi:hypothetical protein